MADSAKLTNGARSLAGSLRARWRWLAKRMMVCLCVMLARLRAQAGGPRFVTGTSFSATQSWKPDRVPHLSNAALFHGPGRAQLRRSRHAQADAMVAAAAAATWNVPTASLILAAGRRR